MSKMRDEEEIRTLMNVLAKGLNKGDAKEKVAQIRVLEWVLGDRKTFEFTRTGGK